MKRVIVLATAYPYTAIILAILWVGSALLAKIDQSLDVGFVLLVNAAVTIIITAIGFKK